MSFREELSLLVRSRYPLIYIPTREEERAEGVIAHCAEEMGNRAVYTWDYVDGYQGNPTDQGFGRRNPLQALELIEKVPASAAALFVLRDYHRFSRRYRHLSQAAQPAQAAEVSAQKHHHSLRPAHHPRRAEQHYHRTGLPVARRKRNSH